MPELNDLLNEEAIRQEPAHNRAFSDLVRVRRRRDRSMVVACAGVVVAVAVAGLALIGPFVGSSSTSVVGNGAPSGPGIAAGSPAPNITPAFIPTSGIDWYLSRAQNDHFYATHSYPSPGVESRALQQQSQEALLADVYAAGLPTEATLTASAVEGDSGAAAVHARLEGGIPVEITRRQTIFPGVVDYPATLVSHVPNTDSSAAAVMPQIGYEFPPGTPGQVQVVHSIRVMTRGGVETTWIAPGDVTLTQLQQWAFAAAAHQG